MLNLFPQAIWSSLCPIHPLPPLCLIIILPLSQPPLPVVFVVFVCFQWLMSQFFFLVCWIVFSRSLFPFYCWLSLSFFLWFFLFLSFVQDTKHTRISSSSRGSWERSEQWLNYTRKNALRKEGIAAINRSEKRSGGWSDDNLRQGRREGSRNKRTIIDELTIPKQGHEK